MGYYIFHSAVLFINTYYGLGETTVDDLKSDDERSPIRLVSGSAIIFKVPFYNSDKPFSIISRFCRILEEEIYKQDSSACVKFDLEDYEFTELLVMYGKSKITKELVDKYNKEYGYEQKIVQLLENANMKLRQELFK